MIGQHKKSARWRPREKRRWPEDRYRIGAGWLSHCCVFDFSCDSIRVCAPVCVRICDLLVCTASTLKSCHATALEPRGTNPAWKNNMVDKNSNVARRGGMKATCNGYLHELDDLWRYPTWRYSIGLAKPLDLNEFDWSVTSCMASYSCSYLTQISTLWDFSWPHELEGAFRK